MLVGPSGSGKSHLGAIWARAAAARVVVAEALSRAPLVELAAAKALLIENADRIGAEEAALFHLLNLTRESGACVLLTARAQPDGWGLTDRRSRLAASPGADRYARRSRPRPDSAPCCSNCSATASSRSMRRSSPISPCASSVRSTRPRAIVAALDREALARGKRVTRAMAAEFLRDEPSATKTP